ncbi:MAG: LLM class flavin-dependent oxidoreductase [Deltaproteobacteria bacterium]|nr:LLM class flavin-dependent oxidoreductase [Deltaproteobacteria bacterium]
MSAVGQARPLGVALAWHCHDFPALLRLVRRAEALGYAAAFVDGDASQMGGEPPRSVLDGWSVTLALLARTERIEIGSIRLVHHWNAARLAQCAATAAHLFGSRFRFLISIGGHRIDRAFGLPFPEVRERVRWLDETLTAARALWRGERVRVEGDFVRLDGAVVCPSPPGGVLPVAVAARSPALLELVAAHADVWDVNLPPVRARVDRAGRALAAACVRRGRDPGAIVRSQWIFTRVGANGPKAEAVRGEFRRLNPWFADVSDAELNEGLVAGPAVHCRGRIDEIRESLGLALPIVDLSGLSEASAMAQLDALAPDQTSVDSGS